MKNPFIKVEWEDTPENLTQERIKRVKTYFENKYNSTNVKIVTKIVTNNSKTRLKSLDVSDNILDLEYQKKLVKNFIDDNKIDIKIDLINRLDDKVNNRIDILNQNKVRYNKWFLKKIEYSNFLSFGDNNIIDLTNLSGITVIESTPRNFGGKSTCTVDLLLFLFFNSTTKTKTNVEIFNKFTDVDEVKVKGYVQIDGDDYIISRIITRKKSKSGEYTVKNELEFYKIDDKGNVLNLSGEQRRETETIITSAIGTEEDFLSTILTTGNNLEELIDSKPTARGQILTKFLGLESLKQKEDICKEMYNDWSKKLVSNTNNIQDLKNKNISFEEEVINSESEIIRLDKELKSTNKKLKDLEEQKDEVFKKRNNDIDQDLIKINPDAILSEIKSIENKKSEIEKTINEINVIEPSKFYLEEEHDKIKDQINDIIVEDKVRFTSIQNTIKSIEQFEKGEICPTCNRPLDNIDHSAEIENLKKSLKKLESEKDKNKSKLEKLNKKEQELTILKKEYEEYEKNKLKKVKYELELEQKDIEINSKKGKLDTYEKNKNKLEINKKIDSEITILKTKIETANGEIRQLSTLIERNENNIKSLKEKIEVNKELIKKIESEEELISVFKTYLTIYGKNGISKVIIKNMIPLLNQELYRLLSDSCYFTLELNINDKNELEFLMIDNETRIVKLLSSGSGYEKTISSLAIRSVLTKVSSLPKPNIVVMDEVFGKIADDNLEMVGEFFKKIKNYFEHIFVISHNPLIRNWSDNIIMINKIENVSSIDYITTKIS